MACRARCSRGRRAVDQGVLVGVRRAPSRVPPRRPRSSGRGGRRRRRPASRRRLRGLADGVVGVDDEGGQQVVAAGEVAVERGGDHAQLAGDGAQRELGGAFGGELSARLLLDGRGDLDPGPCPGALIALMGQCATIGACTRTRAATKTRALLLLMRAPLVHTDLKREQCSRKESERIPGTHPMTGGPGTVHARPEARLVHRQRLQPRRRPG